MKIGNCVMGKGRGGPIFGLLVAVAFGFLGCSVDGGVAPGVDVLPVFGGPLSSRVVVPTDLATNNLRYYCFAPLLYGFQENALGIGDGDGFMAGNDLVGNISFSIDSSASDTVVYTGANDDDTVRVSVRYSPATRTFGYDQYVYLDDAYNVLGNPAATKMAFWMHLDDVALESDDSFRGTLTIVGLYATADALLGMQCSDGMEVYHGPMDASGTGTGVAIRTVFAVMASAFPTGATTTVDEPADLADLDLVAAYIDEVGLEGFKAAGTAVTYNDAYYRIGSAEASLINGDNDSLDLSDFIALLPEFWAQNTGLQ